MEEGQLIKSRYRFDIKNEDVLAEFAKGRSIAEVARTFDCSPIVVTRIKRGLRRQPHLRLLERVLKARRGKHKLCSACGQRRVDAKHGLHFLCGLCYANPPTGDFDLEAYALGRCSQ